MDVLCETPMRFDDHVVWYASLTLEAINVLREELEE
jgi:hypothetical protein